MRVLHFMISGVNQSNSGNGSTPAQGMEICTGCVKREAEATPLYPAREDVFVSVHAHTDLTFHF